ncbi:glucosaminidase domain-containing protein [Enterococcus sp. AZ103]|uniref:glucosaminidase domain-containing protein n=1 Tax=Enterococcus sp. AZ103 TaxID=2774628 RepID=UPI003F28F8A9
MKKIILGSSLLLVALGGVIYMAQGESLKASDEIEISESSQISVETTEATILEETVESTTPSGEESSISFSEAVKEVTPEQSVPQSSVESTVNSDNSFSAMENTTESSSISSTTESTTKPSSSSSTTESTTKPSSSSSTTESTTKPSSSSSTTESTTKPHQESGKDETAVVPSVEQPNIVPYPYQPSVSTNYSPVPTIGNTNPLGEHEVTLNEDLKVSQVAESDLNGYELPLLSSFNNENQGLLVYEGLRQLGEKEENYTNEQLLSEMYVQLFNQEFTAIESQLIDHLEELQPGDTLLVKNKPIGMYLGEDHYLTVKTENAKEEDTEEIKNSVEVALLSERKSEETIVGKRMTKFNQTTYGKEILSSYPSNIKIDISENTQQFIEQIGNDAQKLGLKYDVFASVMIAQAILESGSGSSGLSSAPNYNLFGVKGSYEGQTVNLATQEDNGAGELYTISAAFRKYPSYSESLGDYVTLIREGISENSNYYQEVWRSESKNYLRAAQSLTGKYATDTLYHHKISSIISAYHLTKYDEKLPEEGAATGVVLQSKDSIPEAYRKKMTLPDYDGKNYNLSGSYPVGQCTWYAYNRATQLGGHVDDYMGNGGEWGTKGRSLGYEVIQTPKVGYLISFSPGTAGSDARYGHVAFVEAVTDQGILISEGNVIGGTVISYRVIPNNLAKSQLVSYIKPQ